MLQSRWCICYKGKGAIGSHFKINVVSSNGVRTLRESTIRLWHCRPEVEWVGVKLAITNTVITLSIGTYRPLQTV